jgi:hypothetical protein
MCLQHYLHRFKITKKTYNQIKKLFNARSSLRNLNIITDKSKDITKKRKALTQEGKGIGLISSTVAPVLASNASLLAFYILTLDIVILQLYLQISLMCNVGLDRWQEYCRMKMMPSAIWRNWYVLNIYDFQILVQSIRAILAEFSG